MEKNEYIYNLIQKSEEEIKNNEGLEANKEIETLREKYDLYVRSNVEAGIKDAETGKIYPQNKVKEMFRK